MLQNLPVVFPYHLYCADSAFTSSHFADHLVIDWRDEVDQVLVTVGIGDDVEIGLKIEKLHIGECEQFFGDFLSRLQCRNKLTGLKRFRQIEDGIGREVEEKADLRMAADRIQDVFSETGFKIL